MTSPRRGVERSHLRKSANHRRLAGLTLIEVSLFVGIAGVVLAVMIPTFVRRVRMSKLAEASEQLDAMYRGVAAYHAASWQTPEGRRTRCLPGAAGPTPPQPAADPVLVDFAASGAVGAATWKAIAFLPDDPLRLRYTFVPASTGCDRAAAVPRGAPAATLRAEGDLDDDGEYSRFERTAEARDGELVPGRVARALDPTE